MINEKDIINLENLVTDLDKMLLNDKPDYNNIDSKIYSLRKKLLEYQIKINQLEFNSTDNTPDLLKLKQKLEMLVNNLQLVSDYNSKILQSNQKKSIDTLTIVNTVFLPLALITGYFGMNFRSMGCPTTASGILTVKYGQMLVFILFIVITIITVLLLRLNIIG